MNTVVEELERQLQRTRSFIADHEDAQAAADADGIGASLAATTLALRKLASRIERDIVAEKQRAGEHPNDRA